MKGVLILGDKLFSKTESLNRSYKMFITEQYVSEYVLELNAEDIKYLGFSTNFTFVSYEAVKDIWEKLNGKN